MRACVISVVVFSCFLCLIAGPVRAELAGVEDMDRVCANWLSYIVETTGDWAGSPDPEILSGTDVRHNGEPVARLYTIAPDGFIIVPVLRELPPVKAYSEQGRIDMSETDGMAAMLREVIADRLRLFTAAYGSLDEPQDAAQPLFDASNGRMWDAFAVSPKAFADSDRMGLSLDMAGVGPLLKTAWHQHAPYSNYCPMGDGDRCLVGCVATAAAQVVRYYAWPPYGQGEYSYLWYGDNSCGGQTPEDTLYADFSDEYLYDDSHDALAELNYEMGVAFRMDYGACASGSWTLWGEWIYPQYFRYLDTAEVAHRWDVTQQQWFELLQSEINMRRPVLYQIVSHAIVCDGWRISDDINQYHFNYGWGGSQNVWFVVDQLHCPWEGCDPLEEACVYRIIPDVGIPRFHLNAMSDSRLGDGDGLFEEGETLDITVTVGNYGGAESGPVTITLWCDDAGLTVTNGSLQFASIAAFDSLDNESNPLTIAIPADYEPRVDSFFLELSWENGAQADTIMMAADIGAPLIFLVDDDNDDYIETFYAEGFGDLRMPLAVWDVAEAGAEPQLSDLTAYDAVIWFTGDYRENLLDAATVATLQAYLDAGGKLFLSGQGIAAQLAVSDPDFLNDYLKADYQQTTFVPLVMPAAGSTLMQPGDTIALNGGPANQTAPDYIIPAAGGVAEMVYFASTLNAAVSYDGAYGLVFFSFGFEAVNSADDRWLDRTTLMKRILNFLGVTTPNQAPQALGLTAGPGDRLHLTDHTPTLSWIYSDDVTGQAGYHLQVGSDDNWAAAELWDTGELTGVDGSIEYAGTPLIDGQTAYMRLRVFDGSLWSPWSNSEFRLNSAPAAPLGMTPEAMQAALSATPILTHDNAVDGEGDGVIYDYEVYDDATMTTLVASAAGQPEQAGGVTTWTCDVALDEDADYAWRVRASDAYETGAWSDPATFWVNAVNLMPDPFDLIAPAEEAGVNESPVTFTWAASSDGDPYDAVSYTLVWSDDESFTEPHSVGAGADTTTAVEIDLYAVNRVYWKVVAGDLCGGETECGQVFSFTNGIPTGDANRDDAVNVGDAVFLINYAFKGGPAPDPIEAGDANCDDAVNVGDAVFIINYAFKGGPEPVCP